MLGGGKGGGGGVTEVGVGVAGVDSFGRGEVVIVRVERGHGGE